MMTPDQMRRYCVIVNDGSGCIFQPFDEHSTYILTAKHVIEEAGGKIDQLWRFDFNQHNQITEIQVPCE